MTKFIKRFILSNKMKEIKLMKQSYCEAKDSGLVDKLKLIGIVTAGTKGRLFAKEAIKELNEELSKNARDLGADYVFGIDYRSLSSHDFGGTIVYGDAYKLVE